MKYFDLHCDTATELFDKGMPFSENSLHIDSKKASFFENYTQVFAVWSNPERSDSKSYERFFEVADFIKNEKNGFPAVITDRASLAKGGAIIGVEGANLLQNDISRIDALYKSGLRVLTLSWGAKNALCGSHEEGSGLTELGKEAVLRCFALGIAVDLSHSSDKTADAVLELSKKYGTPVIASHSASRELCNIQRNIPPHQAKRIAELGGIVGINLVGSHLCPDYFENGADISDVTAHAEALVNSCGINGVSVGADFDGTEKLPRGISSAADAEKLYDAFSKRFGSDGADRIFYKNAYDYFYGLFREAE